MQIKLFVGEKVRFQRSSGKKQTARIKKIEPSKSRFFVEWIDDKKEGKWIFFHESFEIIEPMGFKKALALSLMVLWYCLLGFIALFIVSFLSACFSNYVAKCTKVYDGMIYGSTERKRCETFSMVIFYNFFYFSY